MIKINRSCTEPIVVEEATTVKEAVEYATRNHISLEGAELSGANLREANLSDADLRGADLSYANLSCANLSGADLDYSCLPLWCGSLNMKIDKRIFCQLLYHTLRAGESVDDEEVKKLFSLPEVVKLANQFHRAEVCGKLKDIKASEEK